MTPADAILLLRNKGEQKETTQLEREAISLAIRSLDKETT
mgnify:CR=1 FL=1